MSKKFPYRFQMRTSDKWDTIALFRVETAATNYAAYWAKLSPSVAFRVKEDKPILDAMVDGEETYEAYALRVQADMLAMASDIVMPPTCTCQREPGLVGPAAHALNCDVLRERHQYAGRGGMEPCGVCGFVQEISIHTVVGVV